MDEGWDDGGRGETVPGETPSVERPVDMSQSAEVCDSPEKTKLVGKKKKSTKTKLVFDNNIKEEEDEKPETTSSSSDRTTTAVTTDQRDKQKKSKRVIDPPVPGSRIQVY